MSKYRHQYYKYSSPFGSPRHYWQIVGPVGAVHFHAAIFKETAEPSCGLEFHHSARAENRPNTAPDHLECPVLHEPCWHDGTSLYATEQVWPMVQVYLRSGEHEQVFRLLELEYERHFENHRYD